MNAEYCYRIRLEGQLPPGWSDWFEGLEISHTAAGETLLSGRLPDQSALMALLNRIQALNIPLLSVQRWDPKCGAAEDTP